MNRIAAEIAQEIGVLFEHHDIHSGARQQKTRDHSGRAPARNATTGLHDFRSCFVQRRHRVLFNSNHNVPVRSDLYSLVGQTTEAAKYGRDSARRSGSAIQRSGLLGDAGQFGQLGVQVGERAGELLAIARILIGLQLFFDASAGEQQHLGLPPRLDLGLTELLLILAIFFGLKFLNLSFYGFAFPSPGHP